MQTIDTALATKPVTTPDPIPNVKYRPEAPSPSYGLMGAENFETTYHDVDMSGKPYSGSSRFDTLSSTSGVQQYQRAYNQNPGWQLISAVPNFAVGTLSKLVGGVSRLTIGSLGYLTGNGFFDSAAADPIANSIGLIEDYVRNDLAPSYKSRKYDEGNAMSQLATMSWYTNDFVDAAAFAASAWMTSGLSAAALTKLGVGSSTALLAKVGAGGLAKTLTKAKALLHSINGKLD